jgi:antitoxin component YwqK of YwqJK toxin-antitoxin module
MKGFIVIGLMMMISCSKEVIITEEEIRPDLFYASNEIKPFTGTCKVVFSDTNLLKQKFEFKNGILNGEAAAFYKDGKLRWKGSYENGSYMGRWEYWDQQGNKIIEAHYTHDTLSGPYAAWYENGKMKEKGQFEKNSKTGKWIYYNESGQVISETIY